MPCDEHEESMLGAESVYLDLLDTQKCAFIDEVNKRVNQQGVDAPIDDVVLNVIFKTIMVSPTLFSPLSYTKIL